MTDEKQRYLISRPAPLPVRLSDFVGIFGVEEHRDEDVQFPTYFVAEVSAAEYRAMYGPQANIVDAMIHRTYDREGWTITVDVTEVLAAESQERSMQHLVINALRQDAGMAPLNGKETMEKALDRSEIGPAAAQFLMEMYDEAISPETVNVPAELERLRKLGLELTDFCRE